MPYITQFNGAAVEVGADASIVTVSPATVLNDFGPTKQFLQYNVKDDANGPQTLEQGDYVAPLVSLEPLEGTFLGTGSLANAGLTVGNPNGGPLTGLGLSVRVNPIEGSFLQSVDGNVHMITDQPLHADHLGVTLRLKLPGFRASNLQVPLSELDATLARLDPAGLLKPILGPVTDVSQFLLDTAAVTLDFDPSGSAELTAGQINEIVCFARGTLIATDRGEVPVEMLAVGDNVMTLDSGPQPIRWMGNVHLCAAALDANPPLRPVRIRAGALGADTPERDLVVSPQHRILVRSRIARTMFGADEVLVAAKQLLNLDGIDIADDLPEVTYYHFLLDDHAVVTSNGALTESLYVGPQALHAVGAAAREEIVSLFPALLDSDEAPGAARVLASGRKGRKLTMRHLQQGRPLLM